IMSSVQASRLAIRAEQLDDQSVQMAQKDCASNEKDRIQKKADAIEKRYAAQEKQNDANRTKGWCQLGGALLAVAGAVCVATGVGAPLGAVMIAGGAA